jgi:hypothetical protein
MLHLKVGKSMNGLEHIDGWQLAHGVVTGTGNGLEGKQFGHAWLENDFLVYDAENKKLFLKGAYYKAGQIQEVCRYDKVEAARLMTRTGHFGPWEDRFSADDLEG